jgi:hypothetical protein
MSGQPALKNALQQISKSVKGASPANIIRAGKYHLTPGDNQKVFPELLRYDGKKSANSVVEDMEMIALM